MPEQSQVSSLTLVCFDAFDDGIWSKGLRCLLGQIFVPALSRRIRHDEHEGQRDGRSNRIPIHFLCRILGICCREDLGPLVSIRGIQTNLATEDSEWLCRPSNCG